MSDARTAAYRRFVETSPASDDGYLFDATRCRFRPQPSDELVLMPGVELEVGPAGATPRVALPGGATLSLAGCSLEQARAAFSLLPCTLSRLSVRLGAGAPAFVDAAFSLVLFAPRAIAELEAQLSSLEIVRFPGSPYEVVRAYWRNMLEVRRVLEGAATPASPADLVGLLRRLHELALLGAGGADARSSFYLPASALGRKRVTPGELYEASSHVEQSGQGLILTAGARVSVPLLGGEHYFRLLAESVADDAAALPERELMQRGLAMGRVVFARAEHETESRPWFLPPRPLAPAYFERLCDELARADAALAAGDAGALFRALASFHYLFVRLHPLPSANQSLSMSFVNQRLRALLGVGIPHLLLDQLALRFALEPYQRLFTRAVRSWSVTGASGSGTERLRELYARRRAFEALVSQLQTAASLNEARLLALGSPDARAWSLLVDE